MGYHLVLSDTVDPNLTHTRRPRYTGKNPRAFHDKYKELNPARYASEVQKVLASGRTPAGTHRPIMVDEVLRCLQPAPGDVAVDCTLGGGGHAQAILERLLPGGRLIGLDLDPHELPRAEARLRDAGFRRKGSRLPTWFLPTWAFPRCSSTIPIAASATKCRARSTCE
jgi:hypothetical protein